MAWRTCETTGLRGYATRTNAYGRARTMFLRTGGQGWTAWACSECCLWHAAPVEG